MRHSGFNVYRSAGAALQPVVPSAQLRPKGGSARPNQSTALGSSLLGRGLLHNLLSSNFLLRGSFCHGISLSQKHPNHFGQVNYAQF